MENYEKYLAGAILSEGKLVTYRLLSRALKVHVHTAKQMLFEFHKCQNGQKPNSVHATYLVCGEKLGDRPSSDGDVEMASPSPSVDAESLLEPLPAITLCLVQEDQLKDALSSYKSVLSVQVYSLGSHPTKDFQLLSETNNVISDHSNTANSDHAKIEYGGIVNLAVRRKDRKGSKMASATNPTKMHIASQKPVPSIPPTSSQLKNKASGSPSSSQGTSKSSGQKSSMSGTKARGSIMQTFAKAAESKRTQAPQLVQAQATESSSPAMVSDDDGEDGHSQILPLPKASAGGAAAQKARSGREEELRRMMEDDDESGAEEARNSFNGRRAEPSPNSEVIGAGDTAGQQGPGPGDSQPSELVSISGDGRKRGKRKIIKKRQVQDDEGYFVTVRETAWESFSEDEAPRQKKATPPPVPSSGGSAKAKKPAPKGQGSIMSFFSKKQ